jgi:uncharacterized membrane protein
MAQDTQKASAAALTPPVPAPAAARVDAVDLLRGSVMIVMALDHTREFFTSTPFQPDDLARSFPALFFTRWITHFCAPAFFLLAGAGAWFYAQRAASARSLSRFLWTRGAWLVLLELTVIDFAFTFSWRYQVGVVIWTLGWSMIGLAFLVRLRPATVAVFAGATILLHNAFDAIRLPAHPALAVLVGFLHVPFVTVLPDGRTVGLLYPLIPWAGVMAAGYLLGSVYTMEPEARRRRLMGAGFAATVAFVLLRATNLYGNPNPWSAQPSAMMTVASFLNCAKYPPSLCFLLMTLGPSLILLGLADGRVPHLARPVATLGRVPLFFFVLHLYALHLLAIGVAAAAGQPVAWLWNGAVLAERPAGYGYGLPVVYAVWGMVTLALYPVCRWYATLKRKYPGGVLAYL